MWLLGAGAGALLGYGLLRLFPSITDGTLGLLIVIGMAILFGVLGFIGKAFAKIIAWVIGFVIGGGLALAFLGLLSVTPGILDWILALIAGAVVALIFGRFLNWGLIIFAALLGSMLMIRGVTDRLPHTARRNARHADRPGADGRAASSIITGRTIPKPAPAAGRTGSPKSLTAGALLSLTSCG